MEKITLMNIDEIQFYIHSIKHFKRYCSETLESSDIEILGSMNAIKYRYAAICAIPIQIQPNKKLSEQLKGSIIPPERDYTNLNKSSFDLSDVYGVRFSVQYICFDPYDRIYISNWYSNTVRCYALDRKLIFEIYGDDLLSPYGIVYNESTDELLVVNGRQNKIVVYDPKGNKLRTFGHDENMYICAIALDKKGNILVTAINTAIDNMIDIYDPDGNYIKSFAPYGIGSGHLNIASGISVLSDNRIVISDKKNHRLLVFNSDYTFSHWFGQNVHDDPIGIAIDLYDNIIVADSRLFKICVFKVNGDQIATLQLLMTYEIRGIAVNKAGQILISHRGKNEDVSIY